MHHSIPGGVGMFTTVGAAGAADSAKSHVKREKNGLYTEGTESCILHQNEDICRQRRRLCEAVTNLTKIDPMESLFFSGVNKTILLIIST